MSSQDEILTLWTIGTILSFILAGIFINLRTRLVRTDGDRFGRVVINTIIAYSIISGFTVGAVTILLYGKPRASASFWYHVTATLGICWTLVGLYGIISIWYWRIKP